MGNSGIPPVGTGVRWFVGPVWAICGATLVIAAVYFAAAIILLAYAMHESTSPELDALAEMQATALDAATAETQGIMQAVGAAGHRIETLGDSITLGIGVSATLRKLLASRKT